MPRRTSALILGLAALAGGCTVTSHHERIRVVYPDERRVIHEDDAYEGYRYVRVVYLGGEPWYVDDDLRARPIPPHLRGHFRYAAWSRSAPPSFGRDSGMRDGYHLSRIVYLDGVPHHVDAHRHARPIPDRLRSRFAYESLARYDDGRRGPGERVAPSFARVGNDARPFPPAAVHAREREEPSGFGGGSALGRAAERVRVDEPRPFPPAYGRERELPPQREADRAPDRMMPPGQMREAQRPLPPAAAREREEASAPGAGTALGRATGRVRATVRPSPLPVRPQPPAAESERPHRGIAQAPVREDGRRPAPPAADNGRAERHDGRPVAREHGRDERTPEAVPSRKHGKGRGRDDDPEADTADARDRDAARGKGRDN